MTANILGQIETNTIQMRLKPFNSAVFVYSKLGNWKNLVNRVNLHVVIGIPCITTPSPLKSRQNGDISFHPSSNNFAQGGRRGQEGAGGHNQSSFFIQCVLFNDDAIFKESVLTILQLVVISLLKVIHSFFNRFKSLKLIVCCFFVLFLQFINIFTVQ